MTKRWLAILLTLMLVLPAFAVPAFAATTTSPTITAPTLANGSVKVSITAATGASIRYNYGLTTTNIPTPTASSGELYTDAFTVTTPGKYRIIAVAYKANETTSEPKTASFEVIVPATDVTVSPSNGAISGRGDVIFTAAVAPSSAAQKVTWKVGTTVLAKDSVFGASDDLKVKDVTDNTITITSLKGIKQNVQISAVTGSITGNALISVSEVKPADISVKESLTVGKGEQITFKASALPASVSEANWALTASESSSTATKYLETIGAAVVDAKTGEHTFTIQGKVEGTTSVVVKAVNGITKTIAVTVGKPSLTVPAPEFSKPDGTVFTTGFNTERTVKLTTAATGASIKYSIDYGETWSTYNTGIEVPANKSLTIMAQTLKTGAYASDSAIVTATFTSAVEAKTVTVVAVPTITGNVLALSGKESAALTAAVDANDGTIKVKDQSVVFTSSNPAVATVEYDADKADLENSKLYGVVKGVADGTATITVTSGDGKASKKFDVTVTYNAVSGVKFFRGSTEVTSDLQLNEGDSLKLTAKTFGSNGKPANNQNVTWKVEPAGTISVEDGKVVALAKGNAVITVTTEENKKEAKLNVFVNAVDGSLSNPTITPSTNNEPFTTEKSVSILSADSGESLYYTTDGTEPTLDSKMYTGTAFKVKKTTTVKAMAHKSGKKAAYKSEVLTFAVAAKTLTLEKPTATLSILDTMTFKATITPEDVTYKDVVWTVAPIIGSTAEATIDKNGVLTPTKVGKVVVTATLKKDINATAIPAAKCVVTITDKPVGSLIVTPATVSLSEGYTQTLSYDAKRVTKATADATKWSSSDTSVATVSDGGVVTAVKAGTATITLELDGATATCAVTVIAKPANAPAYPSGVKFTPAASSFSVLSNSSAELTLGTITPATGETLGQSMYYGQFGIQLNNVTKGIVGTFPTDIVGTFPTASNVTVKADGTVVVNIANTNKDTVIFEYKLTYKPIANRGFTANSFKINDETLTKNVNGEFVQTTANTAKLNVTLVPTTINYVAATVAPVVMKSDETKDVVLGKINNYTEFTSTAIAVTAAAAPIGSAAIGTDGTVTLTLAYPAVGEYKVVVTLSAKDCADVKTAELAVTVEQGAPTDAEIETAVEHADFNGKHYFAYKKGTQLQFAVKPVYPKADSVTAITWKSSKPKYLSIDSATGIATMLKKTTKSITITASVAGIGSKTYTMYMVKPTTKFNLQAKNYSGKKYKKVKDTLEVASARTIKLTGPSKDARICVVEWKIADESIATIAATSEKSAKITAVTGGTTTLTIKTLNGVEKTYTLDVNLLKGVDPKTAKIEINEIEEA